MAALGMGAPFFTALAASAMAITGLDFLTQRASAGGLPASYKPTQRVRGGRGHGAHERP